MINMIVIVVDYFVVLVYNNHIKSMPWAVYGQDGDKPKRRHRNGDRNGYI